MSAKLTYIRAKREKTNVFLCIQKLDSVDDVKAKLCKALSNEKKPEEIRLLVNGTKEEYTILENTKSLENNQVVYYVYFDRNEGEWEKVNVIEPQLLDEDEIQDEEQITKKEKGKGRA
ncbi:uncharacterized protein BX663DRAFT_497548 [Cokeromyces recurvatus]|uniref:uncharacterized protein n=1 Tax=Cokeromyces recurvatus TaxID=90255 RepID=UPI002220F662|nr:uncharacterized protein BX663DRAFT_497548 [Cokeromyces recurvatus]KAI7906775.1 hypothetical protein BX663DRAFT_497548 [Cokeromyces recurvatus]